MNKSVLILAIAPLLILETAFNAFGARISKDIAQIEEVQVHLNELEPRGSKQTILIVGNSVAGEAVDERYLESELGPGTAVLKAVPDASNVWDWYCILDNLASRSKNIPNIVIVAFAGNQISDQDNLDITRSFGYSCKFHHVKDISQFSSISREQKLQIIAVKVSSTYRLRSKIRHNILDMVIPEYRETLQRINAAHNSALNGAEATTLASNFEFTYLAARDLMAHEAFERTRFHIVAMPLRSDYLLDESICTELHSPNSNFLDLRLHVQLSEDDFRDSLHVIASGRKKVTATFVDMLSSEMAGTSETAFGFDYCEHQ